MSVTISSIELLEQLAENESEIKDATGQVIGRFLPFLFVPPPGFKSPSSNEEMAERRRNSTGGRSLDDVLRHLETVQ